MGDSEKEEVLIRPEKSMCYVNTIHYRVHVRLNSKRMIIDNECLFITKQMPYPAMMHGRHKRFTFAVQNVYHIKSLNELQFMPLTAGTLQNRKCTFVNVIERFAVYNTVSITDCLIIHLGASD